MYVEIPRWTDGKLETKRNEPLSKYAPNLYKSRCANGFLDPIFHDDKKKKPRYVFSVWPQKTYPFNYGSIPQTWEDSTVEHPFTGYVGDNDPMDIFDISAIEPAQVGQLKQVKILGGLAMIDVRRAPFPTLMNKSTDRACYFKGQHYRLESHCH